MRLALISCPYSMGHRDVGTGSGPGALLAADAEGALRKAGHDVTATTVEFAGPVQHELGAAFEVNRLLAGAVREAMGRGAFPLVLAGNCNHCLGTLGGLGLAEIGIVWFDAHGDFHSPETTTSGLFEGMPLNVATGNSWRAVAATIPGFRSVRERDVALIGVREIDKGEDDILDNSAVTVTHYETLRDAGVKSALAAPLDGLSSRVRDIYLHVDIDVFAPEVTVANQFQPPGGLGIEALFDALTMVGDRFQIRGATLASYDADADREGTGIGVGTDVLENIADIGWGP